MQKGKPALDNLANGFKNCDGTAKEMATTMQDNAKASVEGMMGSLETAGIKIEQAIAPTIRNLAEKVTDLANKFSELSPEIQENIIKAALVVAAIGPVLVILGTLISSIGSITGALSAMSAAIAAAGGVMAVLTAPVTLTVAAIAALGVACVLVYQHFDELKAMFDSLSAPLKSLVASFLLLNPITASVLGIVGAIKGVQYAMSDTIPTASLFGDGISKGTQKAVQGYLDLDTNATKSLMSLNYSGQSISKETATALEKTFDDMGTQIKTGMDKHYADSLKTMSDTFSKSSALTEAEEADILAKMQTDNDNKKKVVDDGEKQIKTILDTASAAKRALTLDEQTKINEIQSTMKTNAVKSLSDTEVESKSILERMKQQAGNITALQAAEVVKNSLEQKTKAIANAEEQYDKTVKAIIKQRDETGTISAEQAKKLIDDAKLTKDSAVKSATEMNNEVVAQAKLQAKDHVSQVDWTKGEVKTKWQEMKDDIGTKMSDIGVDLSTKWENIKADTVIKIEALKIGASDIFKSLGILISDTWDGIKTSIKTSINGVIGNIDSFISYVNSIKINVPSVNIPLVGTIGGYSISMPQIPTIPMLAEGGITNGPMQAIIGDNKSGREAVIPIEKIDTIIASAINKANSGKSGDTYITNTYGDLSFPDVTSSDEILSAITSLPSAMKQKSS